MHLPYRVTLSGDHSIFTEIVCAADIQHARSLIHGMMDAELLSIEAVPIQTYCVVEKDATFGHNSIIYTSDDLPQAEFMLANLRRAWIGTTRYTFHIQNKESLPQ